MSDIGTNVGGWPATSMRTYLNGDFYNLLPDDLKNNIIDTTVVSGHGSSESNNFTTTDKIYLLAPKEIYSDFSSTGDTANVLTRQLDYYKSRNGYSDIIKKHEVLDNYNWWLRSADYDHTSAFWLVTNKGSYDNYSSASGDYGVSPAFRIG